MNMAGFAKVFSKNKHFKGTDTFRFINFENIPHNRRKEICHNSVVCEVKPKKDDPNRNYISVLGNRVRYPGDVVTPTGSL